VSTDTKTAAPMPVTITIKGEGGPYEVSLRGDDLDPQRLEAAREIASACAGLYVRALHSGSNMAEMLRHELKAALRRLADLG
jgi:hypothetical protein